TEIKGGAVTTSGAQLYADPVSISGPTAVITTNANIDFAAVSGTSGLSIVQSGTGVTNFNGAVTGITSLTTNAGGTTNLVNGTTLTLKDGGGAGFTLTNPANDFTNITSGNTLTAQATYADTSALNVGPLNAGSNPLTLSTNNGGAVTFGGSVAGSVVSITAA